MGEHRGYVEGFVPFVHVRDVSRSTAFYGRFGFEVRNTYEDWAPRLVLAGAEPGAADARRVGCARGRLGAGRAVLRVRQRVEELRGRLAEARLEPGPIEAGAPGPDRQFRVFDPDGYCVMVTDAAAIEPPPRSG